MKTISAIVALVLSATSFTSCRKSAQEPASDLLQTHRPPPSLTMAIASPLLRDRVPAAIVLHGTCDGGFIEGDIAVPASFDDERNSSVMLQAIHSEFPRLKPSNGPDHIWRIIDTNADQRLLDTPIDNLTISAPNAAIAISKVLSSNEIRRASKALVVAPADGYGGLEIAGGQSLRYPRIAMQNAPLRTWLDGIGRTFQGIWVYRECGSKDLPSRFEIEFLEFKEKN